VGVAALMLIVSYQRPFATVPRPGTS
jgi:hypothetical protein